ncbi:MAG TPA: Nif3-like dinuclear metal center hexameric protein [Tepidisphaeraceae bacterium]|nr:Nif3-like dinuclear metal center hexameric protein [Tepidisphaeraceae bacterium]
MQLQTVVQALNEIAPTRNAEAWDNVGLLAGDPGQDVSRAMLCIDYTDDVAAEAAGAECDLIIAYHPPLFQAVKRLTAGSVVFDAIRRGLAIYSPHTALDVADGGTNDMLADAIGIGTGAEARSPLRLIEPKAHQYKLVTFVPEKDAQRVADALFNAGAGRIGNYSRCSFQSSGTGTFYGEPGANPTVGQAGQLERAAEVKVETVMPIARMSEVLVALRKAHPYEEPAFDLVQLAAPPEKLGQGRIGALPPTPREQVIERIKRELELDQVLVAGPTDGTITRAACCAGACGDMLDDAIGQKADLYLTGEMRHHDAIKAARAGLTVVCTLHSNSERAVLKRLSRRLSESLPSLPVHLSQTDRDPFDIR